MKALKIAVLVSDKDAKKVIGFAANDNVPLAVIFGALLKIPGAPEIESIEIKTASEIGLTEPGECDHPECKEARARKGENSAPKRPAPMRELATRSECPTVIQSAGELGAMLSILSDKIAARGK